MEKKTIGSFLSALRKANGMTQQEVADKLNVSNKTVSKWERDEGCPEIMMLPAIAELFSVSVDEILRGERIVEDCQERKNTKSEERKKYLIEKATVKFTDCSIASVVLNSVALLLAYTIGDIIDYNYIWLGYVIVLAVLSASVIVALIAFNNFTSSLKGADNEVKKEYEEAMKKSIKYITADAFLSFVTLTGLIASILFDAPDFMLILLPFVMIAGAFFSLYIRSLIYKKYGIEDDSLTPAQIAYRKKHIRVTAIILITVMAVSLLLPFLCAWYETSVHSSFSFKDAAGYQYDTPEEAEREYYKLKHFVTGEKALYIIDYSDYSSDGKCFVYAEKSADIFEQNNGGYNKVGTDLSEQEEFTFKTQEEAENFISENGISDDISYLSQQKNLTFDDESLTVNFQYNSDFFSGVNDIMPAFIMVGACVFLAALVISVAVYFSNKKKIA